jgi:DNA polymerase-3 subunit delta
LSETLPVVIVLHGDDLFAIQREVEKLLASLGDPALAELNLTRLDGRSVSLDDVYTAANAMPFLAERRCVVLSHPFARLASEAARERFIGLLDGLPETTALVLVIEDALDHGRWTGFGERHWLRKWLGAAGAKASYQVRRLPDPRDMPEWIRREVKAQGGKIVPAAAAALAAHIDNDTAAGAQEIQKLLAYTDGREIEADDVERLSAQSGQANIFDMVDALGQGNGRLALNLLHRLLEEQDEPGLFGMVVRQFRLLIQAREALDQGVRPEGLAQALHVHPFVASKLAGQAARFTLPRLAAIYHGLLEIDEAVKNGQSSLPVALDIFVAGLAG